MILCKSKISNISVFQSTTREVCLRVWRLIVWSMVRCFTWHTLAHVSILCKNWRSTLDLTENRERWSGKNVNYWIAHFIEVFLKLLHAFIHLWVKFIWQALESWKNVRKMCNLLWCAKNIILLNRNPFFLLYFILSIVNSFFTNHKFIIFGISMTRLTSRLKGWICMHLIILIG